ncbi:hypothetical protein SAMN02745824_3359 [Parasphingorhabdus marina DSM 22363]|uniref:Uncharacterized protein n=1 Tax=Parasphingorhabdus marina DSM 22363 TaxID=1123272 RepID=A0A1N6HM17_9SPHN|nr:hypothetical protein [Parasphingorhabdus marina]SIO20894.1 hypothetical protein SAMN02745824_3359 [Parasphingorhabdus marina DSM 22363]
MKLQMPIKSAWKALLGMIALVALPGVANAQSFSCAGSGAGAYCQYTGKVARAYINDGNLILMYFEQPINTNLPAAVGITGITQAAAGAYYTPNNPEFAEYLYSTIVTALAADKTVSLQFKAAQSGYLRINKIWLYS